MPVEPDPPLSKARRGANRSALEMIRDLTNIEELRKKLANADKWQFVASGIFVVFIIVLLFMYLASLIAPGNESEGPADTQPSVTESPVVQPSVAQADVVAPTEPDAADSSDKGPLSGTWSMWWRNANDSDNVAFTLRFNGLDAGTVEVLNDENAFDTSFTFEDDRLSFGFTRTFEPPPNWPEDNPYGGWPENSTFEGTRVSDGQFLGKWFRDDWECRPERHPPCSTKPEPKDYTAWLEREP